MPKIVNIRNVPEEVHREAKARAVRAGLSLSDYVLGEIRRSLEAPDIDDPLERIRAENPIHPGETSAEIIRTERETR